MKDVFDRMLNAHATLEAIWVICDSEAEMRQFVDWVLLYFPDADTKFARWGSRSAYALLHHTAFKKGIGIDRIDGWKENYADSYMSMTFDEWYMKFVEPPFEDDNDAVINLEEMI